MSDISNLISQMQQPNFYPHTVTEKIEIVQTHAACVFLTGKYAYKINYGCQRSHPSREICST